MVEERIPDFVVIDEKGNRFWEDANVDKSKPARIAQFLTAVAEGKVDAQGAGASAFGHIGAVARNMLREIGNSYAMMAVAGILFLVLGLTVWLACTSSGGDEEFEHETSESKEKEHAKEKSAKDKKTN